MGTVSIRFVTYNICNGSNGGLELALRGVSQANMDLGIFQEKKLLTASIPAGRMGTVLSRRTRRSNTAAEWQSSASRRRILRWRPSRNLDPTSSASSWLRGRGSGTSWYVTLPLRTPQQ